MKVIFKFWDDPESPYFKKQLHLIDSENMNKEDMEYLLEKIKESSYEMIPFVISSVRGIKKEKEEYKIETITFEQIDNFKPTEVLK